MAAVASPANPRLPDAVRRLRLWYWLMALMPLVGVVKTTFRSSLPAWTQRGDIVFLIPIAMILTIVLVRAVEGRLARVTGARGRWRRNHRRVDGR